MKISRIKVTNYRNIDGITVFFNQICSYIIGENNLGKSNFLALLYNVCNGKGFDDSDFFDTDKPIDVEIELKLCEREQGFFGDNFSPNDSSLIKIRFQQNIQDAYPTIVSADTNESIPPKYIRKINYLKYDTTSIPKNELRIDTHKGAGLLINSIVESFIADGDTPEFLNLEQIKSLKEFINERLNKIRSFKDYSIEATVSEKPTDMISRLFYLSDGNRRIEATGSGVKFMAMASINILCQIMDIYISKSSPFVDHIYTDNDGKKLLPLVLSVDEPEVHLHPYLQRSLIGYYKRILKNEDSDFVDLLKLCFNIDGLDGQLIIVTHSTDALVGDYRNLIRFYRKGSSTSVICGADNAITFNTTNEKHLIMHFPEIKEAFYAHCVVLIEGETEYGCIRSFAEKKDISLDDNGICVINARGEGTIKPLQLLLEKFAIPSIAVYDGDVKNGQTPTDIEFFTQELCFEIEIVKTLYAAGQAPLIRQIALDLDSRAESAVLDENFVRKPFNKMAIDLTGYTPKKLSDISNDDELEFTRLYSAWFIVKKGVLLGRIIGELVPPELIPACYSNAIRKAREVANNG